MSQQPVHHNGMWWSRDPSGLILFYDDGEKAWKPWDPQMTQLSPPVTRCDYPPCSRGVASIRSVNALRGRGESGSHPFVTRSKDGVLIDVFVQPGAVRDAIEGLHGESLKLKVKAPPVDDRANRAVERLLAGVLDLPRSNVEVVGGHISRRKRIAITGASEDRVVDVLNRALQPRARPETT